MTCALHVAWDERLTDYHFGPGHPLAPVRVELTMRSLSRSPAGSLPRGSGHVEAGRHIFPS